MNIIDKYLDYVKPLKGSPRYHRWTIVTILAALLERRCWIDKGRLGVLFPNLYTFLVGGPATGKGKASEIAVKIMASMQGKMTPRIGPTKITQAALYKELVASERQYRLPRGPTKMQPVFIYAPELATNMADFGGGTLTNELLDFFDSKGHEALFVKKLSNETHRLINPSLTILGGTTSKFLSIAERQGIINTGLSSRIIFAVENNYVEKERGTISIDNDLLHDIRLGFEATFQMMGEFRMPAATEATYIELANECDQQSYKGLDDFYQNYYGRKPDHIQKIAMVIAASDGRQTIESQDLITAKGWLDEIEPEMILAFGVRNAEKDEDIATFIMAHIPKDRPITQGALLSSLRAHGKHMPLSKDFDGTIKSLEVGGEIKVSGVGTNTLYQRTAKVPA